MKLTINIGKPKELWKTLKAPGLLNKVYIATINAFRGGKAVKYDPKSISEVVQMLFSNMAETLLQRFSSPLK